MRDVLVVGGAGYLGSVLCRHLLRSGYRVRAFDAFLYGHGPLEDLASEPAFKATQGDSRDTKRLAEAMDGVDAVIHLGEIVGDRACDLDPVTTVAVNVAATKQLAQLAKRLGVSRFVYPSSCSVYGVSASVASERSGLNPVSLYARGKIAVERALLGMRAPGFGPVILRLATLYGMSPRPRFDLVVNLMTARAYVDGMIEVDGGAQWRPFVHVSDAAAVMGLCLEAPIELVAGEIFNVGSNSQNFTIWQVAEMIRDRIPTSSISLRSLSDARNYQVSFDKIQRQLGFLCQHAIVDGIDEVRYSLSTGLIDDYREPRYSNVRALVETDAGTRLVQYATVSPRTPVSVAVRTPFPERGGV